MTNVIKFQGTKTQKFASLLFWFGGIIFFSYLVIYRICNISFFKGMQFIGVFSIGCVLISMFMVFRESVGEKREKLKIFLIVGTLIFVILLAINIYKLLQ